MSTNENSMQTQQRLTKVETELSLLAISQNKLVNTVDKFVEKMDTYQSNIDNKIDTNHRALEVKVDNLSNKFSNVGKPNWMVLSAVFTVVMGIMTYFVNSQTAPIDTKLQGFTTTVNELSADHKKLEQEFEKARDSISANKAFIELYREGWRPTK